MTAHPPPLKKILPPSPKHSGNLGTAPWTCHNTNKKHERCPGFETQRRSSKKRQVGRSTSPLSDVSTNSTTSQRPTNNNNSHLASNPRPPAREYLQSAC
uniref:Uncharacterized protein n=1 Tax=Timema douglasi TaxID=61478 RepID=A0A7R8VVA5_TIMDO|nr:unnamed protein product [Timema douglasi]